MVEAIAFTTKEGETATLDAFGVTVEVLRVRGRAVRLRIDQIGEST